jgi:autotransporter passenger strand-loop-strand repeat protein/VCBS repeat-containing protein
MPVQIISSGQTYGGYTVSIGSGVELDVLTGGVISDVVAESGSLIMLFSGAQFSSGSVESGSNLIGGGLIVDLVNVAGEVSGVQVGAGANLLLESGGLAVNLIVAGKVTVSSGATLSGAIVQSGGSLSLINDATVDQVVLQSGASADLSPYAAYNDVVFSSGAIAFISESVSSGQTVSFTNTQSIDTVLGGVTVLSGGSLLADSLDVESGGVVILGSGTGADQCFVSAGGVIVGPGDTAGFPFGKVEGVVSRLGLGGLGSFQPFSLTLDSGGQALDITLSRGALLVSSGSLVSGAVIVAGGNLVLSSGAAASNVTVSSGAQVSLSGGVISGVVLAGGSLVGVGQVTGAVVQSGAVLSSYGVEGYDIVAADIVVQSGGTADLAGADVTALTVSSGGKADLDFYVPEGQTFSLGALTQDTVVGDATIRSGAIITWDKPYVAGVLYIEAGTSVASIGVGQDGLVTGPGLLTGDIRCGGRFSGVVLSLGDMNLQSGGEIDSSDLEGGYLFVWGGAVTSGLRLTGGQSIVYGLASATQIDSWSAEQVSSGGVARSATVNAHGQESILAGGVGIDIQVDSGGSAAIVGAASGGVVNSGGWMSVVSGGEVAGATVAAGGVLSLFSGAAASGDHVLSGGEVDLSSASVSSGDTLMIGAAQEPETLSGVSVDGGGIVNYAQLTLQSGGVILAAPGAVLGSYAHISGGVVSGPARIVGQNMTVGGVLIAVAIGDGAPISGGAPNWSLGLNQAFPTLPTSVAIDDLLSSATVDDGEAEIWGVGDGIAVEAGLLEVQGSIDGGVVDSGSEIDILSGGSAQNVAVQSGGLAVFSWLPIVSGQTFDLSDGRVESPFTLDGVTLLSGGFIRTDNATVSSGGVLEISASQTLNDVTVNVGGYVAGSGTVTGLQLSGIASGITISSTPNLFYDAEDIDGGVGVDLYLEGGTLSVDRGLASGTYLPVSAALYVSEFASAAGTHVDGGLEYLSNRASANGDWLVSGVYDVESGAIVTGLAAMSGAVIRILDFVDIHVTQDAANDLLVWGSNGNLLETIGLADSIDFSEQPDGPSSTEILVTSNAASFAVADDALTRATVLAGPDPDPLVAAGYFGFYDADLSDSYVAAVSAQAGDLGSLTAVVLAQNTSGGVGEVGWQYTVNPAALATLSSGQTVTDSFTVRLSDGGGEVIDQLVSVTVGEGGYVTSASWNAGVEYDDYDSAGNALGALVTNSSGGRAVTQYTQAGHPYANQIVTDLGEGFIEYQDFNPEWGQRDAQIVQSLGGGDSIVQQFDSAWTMSSAVVTTHLGATTVVQDFSGAWLQTDATVTTAVGDGEIVQYFDSHWLQTSAVIVQSAGSDVETQDFDGQWTMTGATLVHHLSANVTETQIFDGSWNQLSADIATVSGSTTIDQRFDSTWTLIGGTQTTELGSSLQQIETFDANWTLLSTSEAAFVFGGSSPQVFTDTGTPTTYVLRPGQTQGDAFVNFVGAATSPVTHDILQFTGYGPGATVVQLDEDHWAVRTPGLATEVFRLTAPYGLSAADIRFVG